MKNIVICGSAERVYAATLACLLADFPMTINLLVDDELNDGRFQELVNAADLQANITVQSATEAVFKTADLLLITDLQTVSAQISALDYATAILPAFRKLIASAMANGFAGKICLLQKYDELFTYFAWRFSGLPQNDIVGFGTFPATLLLQRLLQKQLRVGQQDIRAYVVGTQQQPIIAWSRAYVGVTPVLTLVANDTTDFDADKMMQLEQRVQKESGVEQFALQAICLKPVLQALLFEAGLLSTFTTLHDYSNDQLVAYSAPIYLSGSGVRQITELSLTKEEQAELAAALAVTRDLITQIEQGGLGV
ncbi:Rossmann-fold NAD(P)-binding domain-containing protein [Loigolactobacillus zhaoyuanensis]|uniref:lactate dehydrogenase n=1 Tax=Loigolactobacillus zhaoyuanensis TaxID=2486017 RepID=UPI000F73B704|nr:lactate dehydrogenase [Loigolactobacillus zhaoyuanensis]